MDGQASPRGQLVDDAPRTVNVPVTLPPAKPSAT
jgi:hypothetical protein